jgi:hypothetical protein
MANMHLVTGYAGKTHVTAADHGAFWAAVVGAENYILNRGSRFAAQIVSNNLVRIADGDLLMQGRHVRIAPGETVDLTIENGTAETKRRDLIVVRYTRSEATGVEEANVVVVRGTPAGSSPADPAYIVGDIFAGDYQADFPLYRLHINGTTIESCETLFEAGHPAFFDYMRPSTVLITASTTLALSHMEKFLFCSSASQITLTIPEHSAVPFPVGTMINVVRIGTGSVTFATASGVTLSTQENARSIGGQNCAVTLYKSGKNEWIGLGAMLL